ncbi:MAG: Gfo/Idh/MocA family oxidoreductase [Thermoguttaceae bacterium]|nr:Gfo/Idh/MocA family oxidoreductase [Thermoguttaceae bacterium]
MNLSRRNFLTGSLAGMGAACLGKSVMADAPKIQGFDETITQVDPTQPWQPVSDRKVRVGIVGYGTCQFGAQFGFQSHPNVEIVAVSDLFPDRRAGLAKACHCENECESLEEMIKDDSIEAVFVATDAPSHVDHCIKVMESGKHVATAVPAVFGNLEDADRLLETVRKTGQTYAMFETSAFHDDVYGARKLYKAGAFGKMVYTEGEYYHYGTQSADSYKNWRTGMPVQWYPTHASAYYTCVTGGSFTRVSCLGMKSVQTNRYTESGQYGNVFGTEVALMQTSEGGMARIAVSFDTPGIPGEKGRNRGQYCAFEGQFIPANDEIKEKYQPINILKPMLPPNMDAGGHGGSHGYLCNDFIEAILLGRQPLVNILVALNTTVCGVVAHQSALRDGESLPIPQYTL